MLLPANFWQGKKRPDDSCDTLRHSRTFSLTSYQRHLLYLHIPLGPHSRFYPPSHLSIQHGYLIIGRWSSTSYSHVYLHETTATSTSKRTRAQRGSTPLPHTPLWHVPASFNIGRPVLLSISILTPETTYSNQDNHPDYTLSRDRAARIIREFKTGLVLQGRQQE